MDPMPLAHVVARDIMVRKLVTLKPETDSLDAIRRLLKHRISGAPVVDDQGIYLGVFSEKTSMRFLLDLTYEQLPSTEVRSLMNTDRNRTIQEDTSLLSIIQIFMNTEYRRLPVLRDGKLVGQISRRDVLEAAVKLVDYPHREGERSLLYLSALFNRDEAPID